MKKIIVALVTLVILVVGYWLLSPLWLNVEVKEALPVSNTTASTTSATTLKSGSFTGFDKVHTGSGTAKIISVDGKKYIRFEDDFTVQNGPDLYVGFGKNGEYIKGSDIAKLKGNQGAQNYELPAGADPEEVWIWCRAFSVPFAKAELK